MTKPIRISVFATLCFGQLMFSQETIINSGTTYDFSGSLIGWFSVYDSATGDQTHLRVLDPANISGNSIEDNGVILYDRSILTFSGGFIGEDIWAQDNSQVYMSGGTVGDDIYAQNNSSVVLSGGEVNDDVEIYDNATLQFTGGIIYEDLEFFDNAYGSMSNGRVEYYLRAEGNSRIDVSGGWIDEDIELYEYSELYFSGGTLNGNLLVGEGSTAFVSGGIFNEDVAVFDDGLLYISGGEFNANPAVDEGFYSLWGGTMTLSGTDFAIDGSIVGYGSITDTSGWLTGTLLDGSSLGVFLTVDGDSIVNFSATAIPEPGTYALLMGFIFCLGFLHQKRKKRASLEK